MRSENEMFDLILGTAKTDERIRAVIMNGSRASPGAPEDKYRDYDIVYVVTELASFTDDHGWINIFGSRLMLQMPEAMRDPSGDGHFNYLMLFEDCNRIDLTLVPLDKLELALGDSQSILLLDKDGIIPQFSPPSDADYYIEPPSELYFLSCCNNFWWCLQNVAKGIARDELPYAMSMFHNIVRQDLHDMLEWYIGSRASGPVASGKMGKYFKRYLPTEYYNMYVRTYSDGDYENLWTAVYSACCLFRNAAAPVAEKYGYTYNRKDDENMIIYLGRVKTGKI